MLLNKLKNVLIFLLSVTCVYLGFVTYGQYKIITEFQVANTDKPQTKESIKPKKKNYDYKKDTKFSVIYHNKETGRNQRFGVAKNEVKFLDKEVKFNMCQLSRDEMDRLVRQTFRLLPHIKTSDNLVNLLVETASVESDRGKIVDEGTGDLGIFQIRISTSKDLHKWLKELHPDVLEAIMGLRNSDLSEKDNLILNLPYACSIAVTEYWRKAGGQFHLYINNKLERGIMWKSVYNTKKGKGTVEHYLRNNKGV